MNGPSHSAHDDWRPSASWATLRARAALVERTRRFFAARGLLEVDTPVLQGGANLDHGVLPFRILADGAERFLPTSPEHPLKRLLAAGAGDLWTLAPAFRRQERGRLHSPEFRMLEWYRLGWDDRRLLAETIALLAELTGWAAEHEVLGSREAFRRHAGLDPAHADDAAIAARLGGDAAVVDGDRRAGLDLLLTREVEPRLGRGRWTALVDYPAEASAQARLRTGEDGVRSRRASRSTATASSWPTATTSCATAPSSAHGSPPNWADAATASAWTAASSPRWPPACPAAPGWRWASTAW